METATTSTTSRYSISTRFGSTGRRIRCFAIPPLRSFPFFRSPFCPPHLAFVVWTAVSIGLLIASLRVLEKETDLHFGNWPVLLGLLFFPILDSLIHGQFSLLIVLVYVLAYSQWKKGNAFLGGILLSIALVKFQLVIGFVAILLLKRKWRELAGFATGSAFLAALSVAMVGLNSLKAYPYFVMHANPIVSELPHKANWQGLLSLIGQNDTVWVVLLSIATLLWAARAWTSLDRGFCAAMLAAMLVSYHLTPEDISLAVVPFYLAVAAGILPRQRVPLIAATGMGILMVFLFAQIPMALFCLVPAASLAWVGMHRRTAANAGPPSELPQSLPRHSSCD